MTTKFNIPYCQGFKACPPLFFQNLGGSPLLSFSRVGGTPMLMVVHSHSQKRKLCLSKII